MSVKGEDLLDAFSKVIGKEFRFVDEVVRLDEEKKKIETRFLYNPDDSSKLYLKAHLLTEYLLPGVLLLEGMAQTCGLLAMALKRDIKIFYSCGYDTARFRAKVLPGEVVVFVATLLERKHVLWKFNVKAYNPAGHEVGSAIYYLFAK